MLWYHYFALVSLGICLLGMLAHLLRLVRRGKPVDFAPPAGKIAPAVRYSFTGAMHPAKKESAFLHLPTYTAGVIYHLGTFLSLPLFIIALMKVSLPLPLEFIFTGFLLISGSCGIGILVKRMIKRELRGLSSTDDYLSNILVTLFQFFTAAYFFVLALQPVYFVVVALLLLWLPLGKLKHALYFFAARYHLGVFYGWRGVWPPQSN